LKRLRKFIDRGAACSFLGVAALLGTNAYAQRAFTWGEIRARFEAVNPVLQAARLTVDESRAQEITAHLRPNPELVTALDQLDPFTLNPYRPLTWTLPQISANYLHERQHKRELRLESAQAATRISQSQVADQERSLVFNLRAAFNQILQSKAVLEVARESLVYYDRLLEVSTDRLKAGDIARIDFDRLQLQRVQFQSDVLTAETNVRTSKIQLLALLNDRTPPDQFDIAGGFDFQDRILVLDELHQAALASRPDLKAAAQAIEKARDDYRLAVANGSADPVFAFDLGRNPPIPAYIGVSVTIPLRIFDRNQGEKARTRIDIRRNERLEEASRAQVFGDVDAAYESLNSAIALLRPYRADYLQLASKVRDTISFSYQHGGASLLDFLNAQNEYRTTQLNYLNVVGACLTAANQVNFAVGTEVIP
jgi:cobalt-zinc-cadmium efflux system outer membrane protein